MGTRHRKEDVTFLTGRKHDRIRPHSGDTAQSPGHSTQPRRGGLSRAEKRARETCHEERSSRPRFAPHYSAVGEAVGEAVRAYPGPRRSVRESFKCFRWPP